MHSTLSDRFAVASSLRDPDHFTRPTRPNSFAPGLLLIENLTRCAGNPHAVDLTCDRIDLRPDPGRLAVRRRDHHVGDVDLRLALGDAALDALGRIGLHVLLREHHALYQHAARNAIDFKHPPRLTPVS